MILASLRLDTSACEQMLGERGLVGTVQEREQLIGLYEGNPLALKIVAHTIEELYESASGPFLKQGEAVFGGVRELMAEQFGRLSPVEQSTFLLAGILREPVILNELLAVEGLPLPRVWAEELAEATARFAWAPAQPGSFASVDLWDGRAGGRDVGYESLGGDCPGNRLHRDLRCHHGSSYQPQRVARRQARPYLASGRPTLIKS